MTHHKRRRFLGRRAGCLLCKSWKVNGFRTEALDGEKFTDHRRRETAKAEAESWEETIEQVLTERAEAWEKLAKL